MSGCYTCGGGMGKHDPVAHDQVPEEEPCNGMCVMGNEVMPGAPAHQGHDDDPRGGYYDWAAYPHPECPHPECPRHARPRKVIVLHMVYPDGTHTGDCKGCLWAQSETAT